MLCVVNQDDIIRVHITQTIELFVKINVLLCSRRRSNTKLDFCRLPTSTHKVINESCPLLHLPPNLKTEELL
jgi:hypothetical protein